MKLTEANTDRLLALKDEVTASYEELKARNLGLNLTRGKPSSEQLDIGESLLSLPGEDDHTLADGTDVRNYGGGDGIREIRELWAEVLGIPADLVVAGDASSLNIMFDLISWSHTFGNNDSERPWAAEETVKWICPVPGYDRHFSITETFGYEMVTIPMNEDGPDVDAIRELVKDPQVKGMWVVPVFSNPTGATVSCEVAEALASMESAAPDFRIIWDNAYAVHTLTDEFPEILDIVGIAAEAGNPNRFWAMSSTSKITLAGAGVAFFNSSKENLDWYRKYATIRGIGPNKVNQLAHVRYFGNAEGVRSVMRKHSGILGPKFRAVTEILEKRLGGLGIAGWTHPAGGYFISVDLLDGTAKRTVELAKEAGIALTGAGSAFPLKNDPNNRNLRLAPSLPPQEEVEVAMDGVATCMLLAAIEAAEAAGAAE
ncbi:aminotransferase class I/II-fold pyridoxal phosphate-dependent enzyme [Corynebacterium variabile]|uniref:aminotransferase class I/II-fold pyridoxal phosphate-dependent enzyme n=1 Tax=Corynebacterium variabile TaxID=1727 RepID=UPI002647FF52|nr:aminotransferase class I/II-fold pyridoxal phosphate-dependent enzyme [Corynebacterium variabile]MDN6240617.1 aminotransferase class I/II-fold pyridoxal phosphate-dependent enzyme [Corynebacterium variabile]MDN6477085.1 aminotransferase class I/II-fold pyridoxal phosphate-dependent enzyme [Corynebacterium variabile]MDN6677067.1 aminotransferase class I/II-fold pyridoxal phosphate-dependent enzyme [Corynebacterium variabile]